MSSLLSIYLPVFPSSLWFSVRLVLFINTDNYINIHKKWNCGVNLQCFIELDSLVTSAQNRADVKQSLHIACSHSSHESASAFRHFRIQCEPGVRVKLSPNKNPKWLVHTFSSKLSWDTFLSAPTNQISFGFWSSTSRWSRLSSLAPTKTTENALIRLNFPKLNIFFCPHILSVFVLQVHTPTKQWTF